MEKLLGKLSASKPSLSGSLTQKFQSLSGEIKVPKVVGQTDYNVLKNLPQIQGVELKGNKSFEELGMEECSNQEILDMFK